MTVNVTNLLVLLAALQFKVQLRVFNQTNKGIIRKLKSLSSSVIGKCVSLHTRTYLEHWNVNDHQCALHTGKLGLLLREFLVEYWIFFFHTASLFLCLLTRIWLEVELRRVKHQITRKQ